MIKKIIVIVLSLADAILLYCSIGYFRKGASQPKIISIDGHTTFSWGFYTVGIVYSIITGVLLLGIVIFSIIAFRKKKEN